MKQLIERKLAALNRHAAPHAREDRGCTGGPIAFGRTLPMPDLPKATGRGQGHQATAASGIRQHPAVARVASPTYSLCSIADVSAALAEIRRVLRDGGQLLFCEHGRAPDAAVRRWQRLLGPLWARLAGGCHLGRDIPAMLHEGGFRVQRMSRMYVSGWRPVSFNYWGAAT